ncbi:hypothetical protein HBI56_167540 [Parastagonospora nodorum]|uniref:Uncharacterized protein n=1 Tax=Phaeosphaeria nodorum (strain SN15 / ATCC MYA-4574 / FGSC 10173) TaxID=321614 RepID=A0A7U2I3L4_PHANO|nr:hypothetical protein HBH56_051640 [Parastagonospora nodorum]QRD02121.1 hypothetical protein JI435_050980 [Parastagonospora nodorum SN15]KAH3935961.1 hypothetical protein HBH54_037430 [Parastagonospora nodorum]KAH3942754.1 hypothetical protein HBH53_182960 [Parastagonospora nodorum]KAH3964202.1 hypothetical protein HBH51_162890 [Parastagonospora nodorum]
MRSWPNSTPDPMCLMLRTERLGKLDSVQSTARSQVCQPYLLPKITYACSHHALPTQAIDDVPCPQPHHKSLDGTFYLRLETSSNLFMFLSVVSCYPSAKSHELHHTIHIACRRISYHHRQSLCPLVSFILPRLATLRVPTSQSSA